MFGFLNLLLKQFLCYIYLFKTFFITKIVNSWTWWEVETGQWKAGLLPPQGRVVRTEPRGARASPSACHSQSHLPCTFGVHRKVGPLHRGLLRAQLQGTPRKWPWAGPPSLLEAPKRSRGRVAPGSHPLHLPRWALPTESEPAHIRPDAITHLLE